MRNAVIVGRGGRVESLHICRDDGEVVEAIGLCGTRLHNRSRIDAAEVEDLWRRGRMCHGCHQIARERQRKAVVTP